MRCGVPSSWVLPSAVMVLAGLVQAASIATPWSGRPAWWLQLPSLAVAAWVIDRGMAAHATRDAAAPAWRRPAAWAWVFATAWLTGTFWWLFISMHTYGGLPAWLAGLAVLALAAGLALYHALAIAGYAWISARLAPSGTLTRATVFAAAWTLAELARGCWLTGFPWGAGGYAHVDGPLAGYAPWVGVYGIGALAAWLAMAMARALAGQGGLRLVGGLVVAVSLLPLLAGQDFSRPAGRQTVALLQGNIAQDEKFVAGTGVEQSLRWYGQQLQQARAALVVAPETALPLLPAQLPHGYWDALRATFSAPGRAAIIGVPLGSMALGYTNAAVGLQTGAVDPYRYDKHHLVPFGEFIPPLFRWFTDLMHIPLGDFNRGPLVQASMNWQGQRLAPNVCYEDLFGEELGARFIDPQAAPTVMVNISNIGWFGDSIAIDQHLQISRMRAIEFERPMLRATNTGATVVIDHHGVVTHALPRLTRGVLSGEFEGRHGLTPYAHWVSRWGLGPLWMLATGIVIVALIIVVRRR